MRRTVFALRCHTIVVGLLLATGLFSIIGCGGGQERGAGGGRGAGGSGGAGGAGGGGVSFSGGSSSQSSVSGLRPGGTSVQGSGNVTSEERDVSGFTEVELAGIGNLSIRQTGNESLTVEAEDNIIPKLKTEVENGRLILAPEDGTSLQPTEPISYRLTVKDLNALKVSGSGSIDAQDIRTDRLGVAISGSGSVRTAGEADSQDVGISGSGSYRAGNLESREATIVLSGSGAATIRVSDRLDARISGSGAVEYIGDPTVNRDVRGAGRVTKR